jgi:hypothetical protein
MLRARLRIMLIGWDFDARVTFERGNKALPGPNLLANGSYPDSGVDRPTNRCGRTTAPICTRMKRCGCLWWLQAAP